MVLDGGLQGCTGAGKAQGRRDCSGRRRRISVSRIRGPRDGLRGASGAKYLRHSEGEIFTSVLAGWGENSSPEVISVREY